jgi:hypothetical protein
MRHGREIGILVTIILFAITLAGAGWSQRPILDYYMSGLPDSYNSAYGTPIRVDLMYRNRGSVDCSLKLIVEVKNANVTVDNVEPWIEYNTTEVKFDITAIGHMENYGSYQVKILPVGQPQNFTITYTFEDVTGGINGIISHGFFEAHPYFPTQAVYNRNGADTYELVK